MSFTADMFGGDLYAAQLMQDLSYISHLWDDLIDKNNVRSDDEINSAFERALINVPSNPFFQKHFSALIPLMYTGIIGYMTANRMEQTKDAHSVEIAHGLRYAIGNVAAYAVSITNARPAAIDILSTAWKEWLPERFDAYRNEHAGE